MDKKWIRTKRATSWNEGETFIEMWYHKTPVVRVETTERGALVTLRHNGYKTVTTKARINDFFRYSSKHSVVIHQRNFVWYVNYRDVDTGEWVEDEWVDDSYTIDYREPIPTDETTHEEVFKTMN
jgi:hypothetical protein